MERKRVSSPREEALELASQTRKAILDGKRDTVSVLRACLVIANNLNKEDAKKWLMRELSGYSEKEDLPGYRIVTGPIENKFQAFTGDFHKMDVRSDVHYLTGILETESQSVKLTLKGRTDFVYLNAARINGILNKITDNCLFFLNNTITELQYGGIVEYLMEEIRKNTDETLAKLDSKLIEEAESLFLNLTSTNPADWNKVGHSCRKILKLLGDNVFPPRDEPYEMKDGRTREVGAPQFINRLCAFLDQKTSGSERKFLMAEIRYFESYLRQVVEYAQMGEHKPSIKKFHANMMAIHTYLILSEILKHVDLS